jgi:hypothetical protein
MKIRTQTEIVFDLPGEYAQAIKFNDDNNKMGEWRVHYYAAHIVFVSKNVCEVPIKEVNNNGSAEGNGNNSKGAEEDS